MGDNGCGVTRERLGRDRILLLVNIPGVDADRETRSEMWPAHQIERHLVASYPQPMTAMHSPYPDPCIYIWQVKS